MVKNIFYLIASFAIFFVGLVIYGLFLARSHESLTNILQRKNIDEIKKVRIEVIKSKYELKLFSDTTFIKSYKIVMGRIRHSKKFIYGSTPTGKYFVCDRIENFRYHKLIKLNYPNSSDAAELLLENQISKSDFKKIIEAEKILDCPNVSVSDVQYFGIHGIGKFDIIFRNLPFVFNWTNGSIALSNQDIDEIFPFCKVGTEVVIKE